ncbi:MAG: serine/threonine protein kinase [Deltaproteobacteria bacterium]|nr:serine/threonine protein kinase [Deltaproteobacteria bacterium]MBN2672852.1 serine/threonine protein kinase [Deltaproteobacteria bacterium]
MKHIDYSGRLIEERYRIDRLLGKGGMGAVYLAHHAVIGKKVAVKFLHAEFASEKEVVKRFYREAKAAASIGHKNIVDVLDVGVSAEGEPYLVMEFMEGESLCDMLRRKGPISLEAAVGILLPVLEALEAVHNKGIIHRDLKPDNIFLVYRNDGTPLVKLIDFGISKFTDPGDQSQLTQTGTLLGTPAYMSPEQIRCASSIDRRSDLYAVGVIFYEMLTGKRPHSGTSYNEVLANILTELPAPPRKSFPGFPVTAEPVVMQLIGRDPAERPGTAAEVSALMKALIAGNNISHAMTLLAQGSTERTFALGDLGGDVSVSREAASAKDVLQELKSGTPMEWIIDKAAPRRRPFILLGAGVALLLLSAVVIWKLTDSPPQPTAQPTPSSPSVAEQPDAPAERALQGVTIQLKMLPEGAKVFYDNMPVNENPFQVDKKASLMKLQVEAPGYKPFIVSVKPTASQTIDVVMTKATVPQPQQAAAEPTPKAAEKKRKATQQKAKPAASDDPLKHGSGAVEYLSEFE